MKSNFENTYTVENLKARAQQLLPSFRISLNNDEVLKHIRDTEFNAPTFYYFNNENETPVTFSLLTQDYKDNALFVDVAPDYEFDHPFKGAVPRPYILVEDKRIKKKDQRYQLVSRFDPTDYKSVKVAVSQFINQDTNARILYRYDAVYKNHKEIHDRETTAMKSRIRDLNETEFGEVLEDRHSIQLVYTYGNKSQLTDEIYNHLNHFNIPIKSFTMSLSHLLKYFPEEKKLVQELIDAGNPKYIFLPFGESDDKRKRSLIYDVFNTSFLVSSILEYWIEEGNMFEFTEEKTEGKLADTLSKNKIQMVIFLAKKQQVPFEYLLLASHPDVQKKVNFGFCVEPGARLRRMFNIGPKSTYPLIGSVTYTQDNFKSHETFLIKQYKEKDYTGYTDYNGLVGFVNREMSEYHYFLRRYETVLQEVELRSLDDIEWDQIDVRFVNKTKTGNSQSLRKSDEIFFFRIGVSILVLFQKDIEFCRASLPFFFS